MRIELNTEYRLSPKVKIIWMFSLLMGTGVIFLLIIFISSIVGVLLSPISLLVDSILFIGILLLFLILGLYYIYIELKWRNFKYKFTENNLIIEYGIIRKRIERIPYVKIQNIAIRYDIIHRLLGVGQVIISTAATDIKLSEFSLDAIDDPQPFVDEAIARIEGVIKDETKKKRRVLKD